MQEVPLLPANFLGPYPDLTIKEGYRNFYIAFGAFAVLMIFELIVLSVAISQHADPNGMTSEETMYLSWGYSVFTAICLLIWTIVCIFAYDKMVFGYKNTPLRDQHFAIPGSIFAAVCLALGFGLAYGYLNNPKSTEIPTTPVSETTAPVSLYQTSKNLYNSEVNGKTFAYVPIFVICIMLLIVLVGFTIKFKLWSGNIRLVISVFGSILVLGIIISSLVFNPDVKQVLSGTNYLLCTDAEKVDDKATCCTDKTEIQNAKSRGTGILFITSSLIIAILCIAIIVISKTEVSKGGKIATGVSAVFLIGIIVVLGLGIGSLVSDFKLAPLPTECPPDNYRD